MPYSKEQLIEWCKVNGFDALFDSWVKSGYKKGLKPSVDRVDDFNGYSFCNIRLVTWDENREHQYKDISDGSGTSGKRCKALLKLDREMKVVCEYVSYNSAKRDMGYSLEHQIKKMVPCRNGFYWKYKD